MRQPVFRPACKLAATLLKNSGGRFPRQYFSISARNRGRSGSRPEKSTLVPSDPVIVRGPNLLCSLISVTSPQRIRFSPRNQKCCSTPSRDTTIVPGNENISEAARNNIATGAMSCHQSPGPRRSSLMADQAGKRAISGQARYVSGSGENSTLPSPKSLAECPRPGPRKCIQARRSAETELAALSHGFQIIEIILTRARDRRWLAGWLSRPQIAHPPRFQRILKEKRYTGAVGCPAQPPRPRWRFYAEEFA